MNLAGGHHGNKKKKEENEAYVVWQVDFEIRADMASDSDCHHLAPPLLLSSMASLQLDLPRGFQLKVFVLAV